MVSPLVLTVLNLFIHMLLPHPIGSLLETRPYFEIFGVFIRGAGGAAGL